MNVSDHPLLERARALAPALREQAVSNEAERRVSPEAARSLAREGFFRMLVPVELGGGEVHPLVFARVLAELARGDAATAWCVMTGATTGLLAAYLDEPGARSLFADQPEAIMAGVFAPMGRAVATDGGYTLHGRWPFASGCENSTVRMGGALVFDEGSDTPRTGPDGKPIILSMFFPAEASRVIDTWKVSGLRGTGSHDLEVTAAFVPEHHAVGVLGRAPRVPRPLYAFPLFGLLATGVAAVGLGIARAAIDAAVELATQKKQGPGGRVLAASELAQVDVADAEGRLAAAVALTSETLARTFERAESEGEIDVRDRARVRLAACQATELATAAVDLCYRLGGGTSIYDRCPLQRHFRDIHTVTQHIMVAPAAKKLVGRVLLGLETDTSQL